VSVVEGLRITESGSRLDAMIANVMGLPTLSVAESSGSR